MFVNFKRLLLALYRLEEGQQAILERLEKLEKKEAPADGGRWLQSGIDNILSYQAGKKKGGEA